MESKQLAKTEEKLFDEEDILQHSIFMMCLYTPPPKLIAVRSFLIGFNRTSPTASVISTFTRPLYLPFKPNFASVDFSLTGSEYGGNCNLVVCSNITKSDRINIIASGRRTIGNQADHIMLVDEIQNTITFDLYQIYHTNAIDGNNGGLKPPNNYDELLVALIITFYLF